MKYIKIALLAGGLASVSTLAFAQAGAPTAGVDFSSVYGSNSYSNGSYAQAGQRVRTRAASHATIRQRETTGSGSYGPISGHGSPD